MGEHRQKTNMNLTTKSKNGEIQDYLEVRRPFGAAQWSSNVGLITNANI